MNKADEFAEIVREGLQLLKQTIDAYEQRGRLMESYKMLKIKELRGRFKSLGPHCDEEIAKAYEEYCGLFHAANWTDVEASEFIAWATMSPLERHAK